MMAKAIVFYIFTVALSLIRADDQKNYTGSYLIVAPKTIRPGLPYSASVNALEVREPIVVNIRILDDQNNTVAQTWARDLKAGQPQTATFEALPKTLSASNTYRLYAKGQDASTSRVIFEQTERLNLNEKSRSIFIQTDKAIYKPGATVHFRMVVVTPDLKPYKGKADIKITDPNQNVIKQFLAQDVETGVVGQNDKLVLQLSEEPPLGDWKISVDVDGQKAEKRFTVDKYVLPKFEVTLKPPAFITVADDATVLVSAKYTYGKGVAGSATVLADYPWRYWGHGEEKMQPLSKTVELNNMGEATVRFLNSELKQRKLINEYGYNQIRFTATVTESLTGTQRNGTADLTAHKYAYKARIDKPTDTFKPALDYRVTVSVVTQDDKPLPSNVGRDLFLTVFYYYPYVPPSPPPPPQSASGANSSDTDVVPKIAPFIPQRQEETQVKQKLTLESDGTLVVTLNPPSNASSMRIEARYGSETSEIYAIEYVEAAKSPTHSYLQLIPKTHSVQAGQDAVFGFRATEGIEVVTFQVMTKGYIVLSQHVQMSGQTAETKFSATAEMAPKSRVIVYAVRSDNKEILADAVDFEVKGVFKNNVSIEVNPARAEPNQTVTFTVKAAPSSYVGLVAVDQSVLLLKSGNDITEEMVRNDIGQYDTTGFGGYRPWGPVERRKRSICRYCWWNIGGKDAASIFENSGVVVLTDAYLYREPFPPIDVMMLYDTYNYDSYVVADTRVAPKLISRNSNSLHQMSATKVTVRRMFPETWLWVDASSGADGSVTYKATVPDTITSWITSAFAISDVAGLGIAPEPAKMQVFRPFFIRLDLPYSVKRGEKLALQVLAFNYMDDDQKIVITLDHNADSGFDFIEKPGLTKEKKPTKQPNVRYLSVPGHGGSAATFFPIVPTRVGEVKFMITAIGGSASDAIEMPLLVEAEGFPIYNNKPLVMDLSKSHSAKQIVQLDIPEDAVSGSQRAEVSVTGDIMGPVLNNIEKLVRMPYGCGEQNMLNFVPNIVVMKYLQVTQRLTPNIESKTKKYTEEGYQRQMTYQRDDASYSAFGKSDPAGSTWLTAFVCRSFKQAKEFIYVDDDKLKTALKFLRSQQKENGAFEEHGSVHHKAMQGGSAQGGVPLTAYVLVSLLENGEQNADALNYIERSLDRVTNDAYSLSITAYALHLANSAKKDYVLQQLEALAIQKDGMKHWSQTVSDEPETKEPLWWTRPRPADVEATAYVLLTYILRNDTTSALPLVRWLSSQRNDLGGFSSTQDTVVALQALAAYSAKVFSNDTNLAISMKNENFTHTFNVNPQNSIVLQSAVVSKLNSSIELEASGKGIAYAQISYRYNVMSRKDPQPFVCEQTVSQVSGSSVVLQLCCNYALKGKSNMVVVEANALSGYTIDEEELRRLTSIKDLQRVEVAKGGTVADVYFNSLSSVTRCFNISSERVFQVADQKPAVVLVYDYYAPSRRIEFEYSVSRQVSLEEVCGEQCWQDTAEQAAITNAGTFARSGWLWRWCLCLLIALASVNL